MEKFNLYDFIAVVIPGLLFLWAMSIFANQFGLKMNIPFSGGLAETSVIVALSYIVGLLLQGISQGVIEKFLLWLWGGFPSARWLLHEDTRLSTEYKNKILQIIKQKFDISVNEFRKDLSLEPKRKSLLQKNQEIFYICYNVIEKEKLSDRPQIFNAQYGLFRCLLTTFSIIFFLSLGILVFGKPSNYIIIYTLLTFSFIGTIISYFRVKKRGEDFAKSIYDLFLVHYDKETLNKEVL